MTDRIMVYSEQIHL